MAVQYFNAEQYLAMYPDLAANGITPETAREHFNLFGQTELRAPSEEYKGKVTPASVLVYAKENPDLMSAFDIAADAPALTQEQQNAVIEHYWAFGVDEGRPGALIDAIPGEDGEKGELEEALNVYQAAVETKEANLKDAAENSAQVKKELAADSTLSNEKALEKAVASAGTAVATKGGIDLTLFGNATAGNKASLLKAAESQLEGNLNIAKASVNAIPGLSSKAASLGNAESNYETTVKTAATNYATFEGAKADFIASNAAGTTVVPVNADQNTATNPFSVTVGSVASALIVKDNKVIVNTDPTVAAAVQALDLVGLDKLVAATQGIYDNIDNLDKAKTAYQNAIISVVALEKGVDEGTLAFGTADGDLTETPATGPATSTGALFNVASIDSTTGQIQAVSPAGATTADTYKVVTATEQTNVDALALKSSDLTKASKELADFNIALKEYDAVNKYAEENTANKKAIADAAKAIEDLGFHVVEAEAGQAVGTDADDLFVYTGEKLTVLDFGNEGEDTMFFGTQYSFVALEAGKDAKTDSVGEQNVLEIFAQQDGANVTLYVETQTFSGNVVNPSEKELVKVDLVGVQLDQIDFNSADGFLNFVA